MTKEDIYDMLSNPIIQQVLLDILDEDINGFNVLEALTELTEVTDDEISRQLDLKLNTVRKLLYKLYDARLVDYNREKDEETNWYSYTWKATFTKLPGVVKKRMEQLLIDLKEQLVVEENTLFFHCPRCEFKYSFDEAIDYGFRCSQCNGVLKEYNNTNDIAMIKNQIKIIEEELTLNPLFS
jgi:transcription initiation factor TFIIE subunit alpha